MNHKFNLDDRVVAGIESAVVVEIKFNSKGVFYVVKFADETCETFSETNLRTSFTIHDFIAAADNAKANNETYIYSLDDKNYTYQQIQGLWHMTVCDPRRTILYLTISDFIYHHTQDFI